MPSRIVREGILTSPRIMRLSPLAELFYRRLMSVADDYGRFHASPATLRGACWPNNPESISEQDVSRWISECSEDVAGGPLLILYEVHGCKYLEIQRFGQQIRTKSKFPEPCNQPDINQKAECKANAQPSRSRIRISESKSNTQPEPAESLFEEIWTLYPKKGRLNRILAEQALCDLLIHSPEISETILAPLRPGGKWASSKQWADGYVVSIDKYIRDKRWLDEPEQANGSGSSDLPDLSHRKPEDIW